MILGIKSSLLLTINHIINTIDDSHVWVCVSDKVKNVNVEVFDLISRVSDVWVCVSDKVKNVNVEVFDLISRVSEIQHELCVCKYGLNDNVCNSNQKWNHDECWCERKELDDWSSCKDD